MRTVKKLAALFDFLGAFFLGARMTDVIRTDIIEEDCFEDDPGVPMFAMMCVLISAGTVLFVVTKIYPIPVSTTQATVGAIIGVTLALEKGLRQVILRRISVDKRHHVNRAVVDHCTRRMLLDKPRHALRRATVGAEGPAPLQQGAGVASHLCLLHRLFVRVTDNQGIEHGSRCYCRHYRVGTGHPLRGGCVVLLGHYTAQGRMCCSRMCAAAPLDVLVAFARGGGGRQTTADPSGPVSFRAEEFSRKAEEVFKIVQVAAMADSFAHGSNDAANVAGPLAAIYFAYLDGYSDEEPRDFGESDDRWWILAMGGSGIAAGIALLGHCIIDQSLRRTYMHHTPARGFCVEFSSAFVVLMGSIAGLPLSTTHCQVGSQTGVALALKNIASNEMPFDGKTLVKIVLCFSLTMGVSGLLSAMLFLFGVKSPAA